MKTEKMEQRLIEAYKVGVSMGMEGTDEMNDTRARLGMISHWRNRGSKTFVLHNRLVSAFAHTDVPLDIVLSDQRYPFPCFVIESHDAIPLFTTTYGKDVHSIIVSRLIKGEDGFDGESCVIVTAFAGGGGIMIISCDGDSIKENAILEPNEADILAMLSVVVNTVLYINSTERESTTSEIRSVKIKVGGHRKRSNYIYLHPPKQLSIPSEHSGRKIDTRFMVRGHYRNVAYGPNKSYRELKWIMPYWKGPELAEVVNKTYKLREF